MEVLNVNGEQVFYLLERKHNKNLYARLNNDNVVVVTAPYLASKRLIEKFVIDSYYKLLKKKQKNKKSVIDSNGKVKVLGIEYDLETIDNLDYFLQFKLKEYIRNCYLEICKRMQIINVPNVVFKKVKGYLGQYNKKQHQITLNILIAHLDTECVEYVLVHELSHTRYMNHQEGFWKEVETYLPNYRKLRNKCKKEFVYYENY